MDNNIKRYTDLASLIAILKNKQLTLLDPSKWKDKNDAHYLNHYASIKKFKSIYALCFTNTEETSHHWSAYAPGKDGVCITMDTYKFLEYLQSIGDIIHGEVEYNYIKDIENMDIDREKLPFLKRKVFSDEKEYRIILGQSRQKQRQTYKIDFEINIIKKITLSNSLPKELKDPIIRLFKSIDGCKHLDIRRSTLNDNTRWRNACKRAR